MFSGVIFMAPACSGSKPLIFLYLPDVFGWDRVPPNRTSWVLFQPSDHPLSSTGHCVDCIIATLHWATGLPHPPLWRWRWASCLQRFIRKQSWWYFYWPKALQQELTMLMTVYQKTFEDEQSHPWRSKMSNVKRSRNSLQTPRRQPRSSTATTA